jgi:uncharacterized protein
MSLPATNSSRPNRTEATGETDPLIRRLSNTLNLRTEQVRVVIGLLEEGATIPFIARYRRDQTGGLDDVRLRRLVREWESTKALFSKREEVKRLLADQNKLSPALATALEAADSLKAIEDLYRPFRPKRRTRASDARDNGLQPLADLLRQKQTTWSPVRIWIQDYLQAAKAAAKDEAATTCLTPADCLQGARDILAEEMSDDPLIRQHTRRLMQDEGQFICKPKIRRQDSTPPPEEKIELYRPYETFSQPLRRLKGYQVLAINRGEREGLLSPRIHLESDRATTLIRTLTHQQTVADSRIAAQLEEAIEDGWTRLLKPSLETELRADLKAAAEEEALLLFGKNLRNMLMAPPLRNRVVLALDPGYRNGCKVAVTDPYGGVLATAHIYPVQPRADVRGSERTLDALVKRFRVDVIALGNGTATRETEQFVRNWLAGRRRAAAGDGQSAASGDLPVVIVNESGASVYSASPIGTEEFPDLPVELRSAVSLARRLQDPLAELVKIEPTALGVGQYQHDLNQKELSERLKEVVEDCVNRTGADLNAASRSLLSYIAGITPALAENIYAYRRAHGCFKSRAQLLEVPRLGPKAYEQCAGFLRVPGSSEPLDNTAVHPESYAAARLLLHRLLPEQKAAEEALAVGEGLDLRAEAEAYGMRKLCAELSLGPATLQQILADLAKAGRDDREDYTFPTRSDHIADLTDLKPGMIVQGVVRNVVAFGAFVDIGVHQDGLVHISQLADRFVRDPTTIVRAGQVVTVRVLDVDIAKQRISLSMKGTSEKAKTHKT